MLIEIAARLDFDFFFILIPDLYQVNRQRFESKAESMQIKPGGFDVQIPNRILSTYFRENEIPFIDLTDCIRMRTDVEDLYYIQDNHFTKRGHQAAARCLQAGGFDSQIKRRR